MSAVTHRPAPEAPEPASALARMWRWIEKELDRPNSTMVSTHPGMTPVRFHRRMYGHRFGAPSSPFGL